MRKMRKDYFGCRLNTAYWGGILLQLLADILFDVGVEDAKKYVKNKGMARYCCVLIDMGIKRSVIILSGAHR